MRNVTVLKIETFQVMSTDVHTREHSLMTWKTFGFWNCDIVYRLINETFTPPKESG